MSYTTTDFQTFLACQEPFTCLSSTALTELSGKLKPLRYRIGQAMLVRDKFPAQIAIIYEGQARLLGYDPLTQMPVTLSRLEPGAIVGSAAIGRGLPCETAIASTASICLTIATDEFQHFLDRYPELRDAFAQQCSLAEAYDLLGKDLARQPQGGFDLRGTVLDAAPAARVVSLSPGHTRVRQLSDDHLLLDTQRVWLLSSGKVVGCEIGERLHLSQSDEFEVRERAARAIGFRIDDLPWMSAPVADTDPPPRVVAPAESGNGSSMVAFPADLGDIPEAPADITSGSSPWDTDADTDDRGGARRNAIVRSKSDRPLDTAMAVYEMLSRHFGLPFRREVIRRILADQIQRTGSLSIPMAGAVAELMGLKAQLVNVPVKAVSRLTPPVLIRWQDQLAILYRTSDRELVLGVPTQGQVRISPSEFADSWGEGGQVLLLEATKETPQQRFGLQWFWPSLQRYRGVLITVFIASFFVQLLGLANPLMIQVIIDKVIVQNSLDTLNVLGVFLLVVGLFEAVLGTMRTYLFVDTTNRIDMTLGSEIIDHLLRLPLRYFEKRPVGELSSRVNELEKIRQFLTGTALTVVLDSIFSVVYIFIMAVYSLLLTAVSLSTIPLFIGVTLISSPIIRRQLRAKAERNAETQSHLVEVLSGIQTVKAQNVELRARWRWQERYARYVSAGFKTVITSTLAGSASNFLNKFSGLIVLWVGAFLVLKQELTLGQLIAFRIIAGYVTSPLLRLAQLWQNFQEIALSLERLSDIVDTPEEAEQDRDNIPMPLVTGNVCYESVAFRFKPNGPLQLNNVSLDIPAGKFVGIVGESGAGKSTLTKLLARLYEPESGRILLDNYDIAKVELYSLRRQIGVVPQETLLFDGTVQENIALTNPDATTEEIINAAEVAAAHEFIMGLPSGYNTRVGERGSALSGGQRQRIAIARSVLQRPQMLVLDEATSALDYNTERQVCINLAEEFGDRTVFFITHRLSTIKNADVILMMDAGRVVEQGTHDELMEMQGRYFYLYQQQESKV
ncbi:type I secretion system ABC transporter (HlyB family) [Rubidibacter lacunae KORDI 51-2]|uniref:Type I secretion system ABC transporter (HlyB family) n=1 Tax=Rubidibacter lacunae KORDI 51-2 TaxID=582515 RepID=U5DD79_9CHRO|nr:peptidase domain-containing ABC transporter [Rubidibacter lacunae]ERN42468.1 type I secretion system ABC transporter (HlyB family) [Rubidibacter lacunae KORDI 51-2]